MKTHTDELRKKLMKALRLQAIDQHESLTFLHRNYGVRPSEIITVAIIIIAFLLIILDGCGILASIFCFLLPCLLCLKEISNADGESHLQNIKSSQQHQSSHYTDEQISQLISNSRPKAQIVQVFIVYFVFYSITEVVSPFMNLIMGSISWLIIRCLLTFVMIMNKKQKRLSWKVLEYIKTKYEISHKRKAQF